MSGNRTGPAANAAGGDVQHVQPGSEQTDDTGKGTATKRGRDPFVVKKDTWLRRARADKCLTDSAFRILSFISDHAGIRTDGFTWFSYATIAAGSGMSISAVRRGIRNAKSCDFLRVVVRGDKGKSNECWPCLDGNPLVGKFPLVIQVPHAATGSGGSSKSSTPPRSNSITPTLFQSELPGRPELSTRGARNRTPTFLSDPLNDPPKTSRRQASSTIPDGAQATDDDGNEVKSDTEFLFELLGYAPSEHPELFKSFLSNWPPMRAELPLDLMEDVVRHAVDTGRPRQPARSFNWFVQYARKHAAAVAQFRAQLAFYVDPRVGARL